MTQRLDSQIQEKAAGLHPPALYNLLSFYQALQTESENYGERFVPFTSASVRAPLMFAVGLIPPSSVVTGQILDRTATHLAQYGPVMESAEAIETSGIEEIQGNAVNDPLFVSTGPNNSLTAPRRQVAERSAAKLAELHPSIQPLCKQLLALAAQQGINIVVTQGFRTFEEQDRLYAKGRTAPGGIVTGAKGGESWHNFNLAFDVAMVAPGPTPPTGSPSWPPQHDQWRTLGSLGQSLGLIWGGTFSKIADLVHFEYHPGFNLAQARAGVRPDVTTGAPSPILASAQPASKWKSDGAANANKASKTADQVADKALNQTDLGKTFGDAQRNTINQMQAALKRMAETPPLRMLVNPQSFRVTAEHLIASGNWSRTGPIIEHWGENQDKIEGSGKIAAFYSMEANASAGQDRLSGLTRTARQFSTSYQNLLSLFLLYKNNGGIWLDVPDSHTKDLAVVGSVYLYYDSILYIGSFDSLSLTEGDDAPFSLDYQFSFTVRAWYILDHLDDHQYTYRTPPSVQLPTSSGALPLAGVNNAQPNPTVAAPMVAYSPMPAVSRENDPLFGLAPGEIGDNLEGING